VRELPPSFAFADTIALTNATGAADSVLTGGCVVQMVAYATPDRSGSPVYDQPTRQTCDTRGLIVRLAPEARRAFGGQITIAELKSAGVAPGHYWLTATMPANNTQVTLAAGDGDFAP
jgi:hypothetical protein